MFERYTEQARRAVFYSREEAIHRDAAEITSAHLLSGVAWEESSRANAVASLKDKIVDLFGLMGLPHRPCTAIPYLTNRDVPLTKDGKLALAYAAEEADRDSQYAIDTDHLLRGILRFPNESSVALGTVGVTLKATRKASRNIQAVSGPVARSRMRFWFRSGVRPYLRGLGTSMLVAFCILLIVTLIACFR
jgi:hypothetical protein